MTVGFLQGRSDYEPEPGVPLDYVGHGFKRFTRVRDRLRSAGVCGASCPISCPSQNQAAMAVRILRSAAPLLLAAFRERYEIGAAFPLFV